MTQEYKSALLDCQGGRIVFTSLTHWRLPPLRPNRSACGVAGLVPGDASDTSRPIGLSEDRIKTISCPKLFHLTIRYMLGFRLRFLLLRLARRESRLKKIREKFGLTADARQAEDGGR